MCGLYIHIPFCRRKCVYCDFFSCGENIVEKEKLISTYKREMSLRADELSGGLKSIYIGGGTPSLLSPSLLQSLIDEADRLWGIAEDAEITVEVNPDDIDKRYVAGLRGTDINRISVGIQSLNDDELGVIGRRHNSEKARNAMELLRGRMIIAVLT